ncbi:MAG: DUF1080 domain-containing protein, partial [Anaerolineae bacterium]|nr:DUF1080 domain-containing protein [Anaerolineae bacterium]
VYDLLKLKTNNVIMPTNEHTVTAKYKCGGPFNSQFKKKDNCWANKVGSWNVKLGKYVTNGYSGKYAAAMYRSDYGKLNFSAKMKRTGTCPGCANKLIVRGTPKGLDSYGIWKNEYMFQYSNYGGFSIYKSVNGTVYALIPWTYTSHVVPFGWNTLQVKMNGTNLAFYINGSLVAYGSDASLGKGKVGLAMYTAPGSSGQLLVDWAKLNLKVTATAEDLTGVPVFSVGTPGGDYQLSPNFLKYGE